MFSKLIFFSHLILSSSLNASTEAAILPLSYEVLKESESRILGLTQLLGHCHWLSSSQLEDGQLHTVKSLLMFIFC